MIQHYEAFLIASMLLNLTPGNDTIYILSRSLAQGRPAGLFSVLGIASGSLVHTTLAALGLSALLQESAALFQAVKWAGAAYLVYIGVKMWLDRQPLAGVESSKLSELPVKKIYRDGFLTNLFNPKVALFFIAFLPQFIDPTYAQPIIPFLLLGLSFTVTGTLWCLVLVFFAAGISGRLHRNPAWSVWINKACGAVMVGLGIRVAVK